MSSNGVVIVLCVLSLGATTYLAASLPWHQPDEGRVAALEAKLAAAERRADAVESLRSEVRQLRDRLDRAPRRGAEPDAEEASAAATRVASTMAGAVAPRDAAIAAVAADGMPMEDAVADRVEKKISERLEAMSARESQRGDDGKWKAPIDDLAKELALTDAQKAEAKRIFERSRDSIFALLQTTGPDGGSVLDDFVDALRSGADPTDTSKRFFQRLVSEHIPGTDRTYIADFITLGQGVEEELGKHLDATQMKRLRALHVDLLDVKTGYDPVGEYMAARVQ